MSRFHSYLNTASVIITQYSGDIPFTSYLKKFFSSEKKYGSKDRKNISTLCYNYFRAANALKKKSLEEKIILSHYLCSYSSSEILQHLQPGLNEKVILPTEQKLAAAGVEAKRIFPFNEELSEGIKINSFNVSFLIQPDVFIRIRPGQNEAVLNKLKASLVSYNVINNNTISFEAGVKIADILKLNTEVVIQDVNSQRVGELMLQADLPANARIWDCCAASGGKSIMAYDMLAGRQLTVSDVRETIIHNLHKRFAEAGIKNYISFIADITNVGKLNKTIGNTFFDFIICDAPCSGSGTWSRTPEQLLFFKQDEITRYSHLQKSIVSNTIPFIKQGGYFLYITCSVFKKENEEVVDFILKETDLVPVKAELFKGYNERADSMFAALFQMKL